MTVRAVLCLLLTLLGGAAAAQDLPQFRSVGNKATLAASGSAKDLFGSVRAPARTPTARAIGSYAKGCAPAASHSPSRGGHGR